MKTAIIIEDEALSAASLKNKIEKIDKTLKITGVFTSSFEASKLLIDLDPDLVFLDIEMPEYDGFWFLEKFPKPSFEVIITTAHDVYAIKAIKFSAIDFLLKPIILQDLEEALKRFHLKAEEKLLMIQASQNKLNAKFDKLPIPTFKGLLFLPIVELIYLKAEGNYTNIYLLNGNKILSSKSIGDYDVILTYLNFFRIHHSYIINLNYIKEYIKGDGGSVILIDNTELDVSKRKKKELMDIIGF